MKTIIFLLLAGSCLHTAAQNNLTANIIEGGKTLVDLIRVIKSPKTVSLPAATAVAVTDSCAAKNLADISYKNTSAKAVFVSLYKRSGAAYATIPLTLKISGNSRESLYEIPAGIYKYRIEYMEGEIKILHKEGEIKLLPCDKLQKEIKDE
jgi:hypothetical protein